MELKFSKQPYLLCETATQSKAKLQSSVKKIITSCQLSNWIRQVVSGWHVFVHVLTSNVAFLSGRVRSSRSVTPVAAEELDWSDW